MWLFPMVDCHPGYWDSAGVPTLLHGIQGSFLLPKIIILNSPQGMYDDVLKNCPLKKEQHPQENTSINTQLVR